MSKPDWAEAPEGATHYDCNADVFCTVDGWWSCKRKFYAMSAHFDWNTPRYTPRPVEPAPTAWNGTGFPPVGAECEVVWLELPDGGGRDFEPALIKGYFYALPGRQVWFSTGEGEDFVHFLANVDFRPTRTQAQRERDEIIIDALRHVDDPRDDEVHPRQYFMDALHTLYDAGMLRRAGE